MDLKDIKIPGVGTGSEYSGKCESFLMFSDLIRDAANTRE